MQLRPFLFERWHFEPIYSNDLMKVMRSGVDCDGEIRIKGYLLPFTFSACSKLIFTYHVQAIGPSRVSTHLAALREVSSSRGARSRR